MARRRFRVEWAEAAARDLEEIVAFITLDSRQDAERVVRRLEARAAALESSPARGRVVPELAHFQMRTWRELVIRPR
jgi:plasmid stabilization system protein ParE